MDYQASKITYSQVVLFVCIIVFIAIPLSFQKAFADGSCQPAGTSSPIGPCTATSVSAVSVSAVVIDPNAATTTPPSGGGGGGGGPITPNPIAAVITLSGRFAPNSVVSISLGGVPTKAVTADSNGLFALSITGLSQGLYSVSLVARDAVNSTYATAVSYSFFATTGVETFVSNIKFPPLLALDKTSFKPNENIIYSVRNVPGTSFEMFVDGVLTLSGKIGPTGSFSDVLGTKKKFSLGKHVVKLREKAATITGEMSSPYEFFVGQADTVPFNPKVPGSCPKKGDFNADCKVNIIDFSILAYWHNRTNFPKKFDLNSDGKINVKDFSILAFYWTG